MQLVQVYDISLQAAQTAFAGFDDVLRAYIHRTAAHPRHAARGARHLGRQNQLLAYPGIFGDPVTQKGFGHLKGFRAWRHGIHFCRVPESHTPRDGVTEQAVGAGLIDLLTKGHGPQANRRYMQLAATKLDSFHGKQFNEASSATGRLCGARFLLQAQHATLYFSSGCHR